MDAARKPPLWLTIAATVATAAGYYFGTGIHAIAALAWVAPLPVLLLAPRWSAKLTPALAFIAALLGTTNNLIWYLTSPSDARLWPMGVIIMLCLSVPFALGVWAYRSLLLSGRPLAAVVTLPAIWVAFLYLVAIANPTGIMGTLVSSQGDVPLVLQTAAVTGMWGVEFGVLFVPAAIAALFAPTVSTGARLRTAVVAATVAGLVVGLGIFRLTADSDRPTRDVALLSYNDSSWGTRMWRDEGKTLVDAYEREIAALPGKVDTVVLPEGEFTVDADSRAALVDPFTEFAHEKKVTIVLGFVRRDGPKRYNSVMAIPATGEPVTYLKHHDAVSVPGKDLVFVPGSNDSAGLANCADLNFTNPTRDYAAAGARMMLVPAADERHNGRLHSRSALMRTVENGSSLVWASRTGTLTVADGYGRVLAEKHSGGTREFTRVVAAVPQGPGATVFTRLGDVFAWLCIAAALAGAVLGGIGKRGRTRQ